MNDKEKITYVLERLEAWFDGARIAAKALEGTDHETGLHNTMMNYAHLIDVLNKQSLI